jgi:hypothetical protein
MYLEMYVSNENETVGFGQYFKHFEHDSAQKLQILQNFSQNIYDYNKTQIRIKSNTKNLGHLQIPETNYRKHIPSRNEDLTLSTRTFRICHI